ncbi:cytochrome C [Thermodesulfobacteriota bacterium]
MFKRVFVLFFTSLFLLAGISFSQNSNITYDKDIKKVMVQFCESCHGSDAPDSVEYHKNRDKYVAAGVSIRMDRYEYLMNFVNGDDFGALSSHLDDGKNREEMTPGSMYQYLGETEDKRQKNLQMFKDWLGHWSTATRRTLEQQQTDNLLASALNGEEVDETSIEDQIKAIIQKIKAPRN